MSLIEEPLWLSERVVVRLNASLVAAYGGAGASIRDANLLGSALGRPQNLWVYGDPAPTLYNLAAAYGFGIARNHHFVDGNKRTALMAVYTFLGENGVAFDATEAETVVTMQAVAEGSMSEADFAAWLANNSRASTG